MKTKDLTAKSAPELDKELTELYKTHFGLRMQKATQQLTNTSQLGNLRRDQFFHCPDVTKRHIRQYSDDLRPRA